MEAVLAFLAGAIIGAFVTGFIDGAVDGVRTARRQR